MRSFKVLRNTGAGLPPYAEGQVITNEAHGDLLCRRGLAVELPSAKPVEVKGVSEKPAIAESAPAEIVAEPVAKEEAKQEPPKPAASRFGRHK